MIYLAYVHVYASVPTSVYIHQYTSRVYTECGMTNNQIL